MDKLKETQPKIKFLGYRCVEFTFKASEEYINGESPEDLQFTVNYGGVKSEDVENRFIENFELLLKDETEDTKITGKFIGLFESTEKIDDDFIESHFIKVNAPAILYPFIRSYVSTVTINACIPPILIPTLNFSARAMNKDNI
eukprot:TRINITY_DN33410_c0_g1_i1.p1 TRINITY_DN33410_c0_g1~~TRINITY_DN33410_c0_g1_i1.p1  ORF type:complete len:158 (+),score=4.83 TRINITY_DN33410_c0_g1_i1:48-476(+)